MRNLRPCVLSTCVVFALSACGDDARSPAMGLSQTDAMNPEQTDPDMLGPEDLPTDRAPTDVALFEAWLEEGAYQSWDCQAEPHAAIAPSPHGDNRICQNQIVSDALNDTGDFPVGATLVKEVYRDGKLDLLAVETRVATGEPTQSWLYFEGRTSETLYAGLGIEVCTHCHAGAARDYVWSVVK